MKSERQERILELISQYEIETQDEMMTYLQNEGFKVTQATVSRDLKELKLTKTLTPRGTYRYSISHHSRQTSPRKFNNAIADSMIQVEYAMNIVVVKTYPGLAAAVASAVDSLDLINMLGCVAGDDTIIIITKDEPSSREISKKIKELMRSF